MQNIQAIILAAGKSTRFKTGRSKLLEKICGQEMILYGTRLLEHLHIPTTVVVGFQRESIIELLTSHHTSPLNIVVQEEQLGTGHAVRCTREYWQANNILVMNGDMPLLSSDIIQQVYETHQRTQAAITFVIAHHTDSSEQYGRVVERDGKISIVEASEFTGDAAEDCCINAGVYLIRKEFLESSIVQLDQQNAKKEFYLTDLVKIASGTNLTVQTVTVHFDRIRGINTMKELWIAEQIQRADLINYWMSHGVRFSVAQNVHLDYNVSIGAGTTIGSGVILRNGATIGSHATIGDFSIIDNSFIADRAHILPYTLIQDSRVDMGAQVGPYAHLRNHTVIGSHATIGNFVEIKKSNIGAHTKAKHLSYLGDAQVGDHVNIGAGTITCNHNGVTKNTTVIQDGAYIGTNNSLVAPVTIGKEAYTAAGSTITEDVPALAMAIARSRQVTKHGYAQKIKNKLSNKYEEPYVAAVKSLHDAPVE